MRRRRPPGGVRDRGGECTGIHEPGDAVRVGGFFCTCLVVVVLAVRTLVVDTDGVTVADPNGLADGDPLVRRLLRGRDPVGHQ